MHLSICIPIYQVDVTALVNDLIEQAEQLDLSWDIVCMDDGSDDSIRAINRPVLQTLYNVSYIELSENIGRSKIRNWLSKTARGSHLLYIDADSGITRQDYLQKYVDHLPANAIYGGRNYRKEKPENAYLLHWRYGNSYEDRSVKQRRVDPVHSFLSCNCLLSAAVVKAVPFNEEISGYGYEDLVLAEAISALGYSIQHIDNPVTHLTLDDNAAFIKKTKIAVHNLYQLNRDGHLSPTRLVRWAKKADEWEVTDVIQKTLSAVSVKWEQQLNMGTGSLLKLQLLKLSWFLGIKKEPSDIHH